MNKLFVPYDIALALKEIEFDEPCFGYYTPMKSWMMEGTVHNTKPHFHGPNWANRDNTFMFSYVSNPFGDRDSTVNNSKFTKAIHNVAVPLYQQVIDWFREKHNIHITIDYYFDGSKWEGKIDSINNTILNDVEIDGFHSYYEALEGMINKAIKIIKI